MKKIIFTIAFLPLFAFAGWGQDLLSNTISGRSPAQAAAEPNAIAQLIEDRKAQKAIFQRLELMQYHPSRQTKEYEAYVSEAVFLDLDRAKLNGFLQNPARDIVFSIPVAGGRHILLELTQVNVVSLGFAAQTSSGRQALDGPTGFFYHGIVKGDPGSLAAISIFRDHVRVMIADEGGNYVLGKLKSKDIGYVLYNDKKLKVKNCFICSTPEIPISTRQEDLFPEKSMNSSNPTNCVQVYVECDYAMYEYFESSLIAVVDYVFALFNEVFLLFRREEIKVEISELFIWSETDPYSTGTNTISVLDDFFIPTRQTFNGNIAHLLSTRSLGGGAARGGPVCNAHSVTGGVGNSIPSFPTYSQTVSVVTHELGHNLGSPHTHACRWNSNDTQIDDCGNFAGSGQPDGISQGCFDPDASPPQIPIIPLEEGGTIMSYCHRGRMDTIQIPVTIGSTTILVDTIITNPSNNINFNLGFGPQPGDRIRNRVAAASCLNAECSCEEFTDRVVNGNPIPSAVYIASNSISSEGVANAPTDNIVIFRAGNRIELNPGFIATELFVAEILSDLCDGGTGGSFADMPPDLRLGAAPSGSPAEALHLYPNPASTRLYVAYKLEQDGEVALHFANQYGQVVRMEERAFQVRGERTREIVLDGWPAGLYYAVLRTASGNHVKAFVVASP